MIALSRFAASRFAPLRSEEDRLSKVHVTEVRPAEVRTGVRVLATPRVPGLHALLEQCDVLVVRH